jgi:uncharacterized OsmC-like protein
MPTVTITRSALGSYTASNEAGATIEFGEGEDQFTPVELLLVALGGCTGMDVDYLTSRRAEPLDFEIAVDAEKLKDPEQGNLLQDVTVTFRLRFPQGEDGDRARTALPTAVARSHDRLCTVGRSLEVPTPITNHIE